MPALAPVPSVVKLVMKYTYSLDTDVVNHLFFKYSGTGPANADLNTWLAAVQAAWISDLQSYISADVTLDELTATDLTSPTAGIGSKLVNANGLRGGPPVPAGTAFLFNYEIQRRYRGGKPRTYVPLGVSSDVLDGQDWTSTFHANALSGWTAFIAGCKAAPMGAATISDQVNVGYYHGFTVFMTPSGRAKNISTPLATPHVDPVVAITAGTRFASQRRRNRP
jgi:hypothetical protein